MKSDLLLRSETARKLYAEVKDLPIYDYHCHLNPKEIWEDKSAGNLTELWLGGDHYKWRLMRQSGIEEKYITGDASPKEKLRAYAAAISTAPGNPLYIWSHMELSRYFGIEDLLTPETSDAIFDRASEVIARENLSPRKLIAMSNVAVVCTTDDPADELIWHEKLAKDDTLTCRVLPSYRPDKLMLVRAQGYGDYLKKLEAVSGVKIDSYASLMKAAEVRLDAFVALGCVCTDLGIPAFPSSVGSKADAEETFAAVLAGKEITDDAYGAFLGRAMVDLAALYKSRNMLMQIHMAVLRNVNTPLFKAIGVDAGGDCISDPIPGLHLTTLLNTMHTEDGLPSTVLYTLNPSMNAMMSSIAGSFPNVVVGAAWWFCDHARGIEEVMNVIAETGQIGSFYGMLTDSRSFLSYTRHDYFRRILCSFLADFVDRGEFDASLALPLAKRISCENIANKLGK